MNSSPAVSSRRMRQRLIILGSTAIGGAIWLGAVPALQATNGGGGLSFTTAQGGVGTNIALVVAYGLPALILAVITACTGHLITGMFVLGASMMFLAATGGPMNDWLLGHMQGPHSSTLPQAYSGLIIEAIGWQVAVIVALLIVQRMRGLLRPVVPHDEGRSPIDEVADHHPQPTVGVMQAAAGLLIMIISLMFGWSIISGVLIAAVIGGLIAAQRGLQTVPAFVAKIASMLLCAFVAGVVGLLLIRDTDTGQVLAGLVVAFMIGGIVAQTVFPQHNPIGVIASPLIVAVVAYVMAMQMDGAQIHERWIGLATSFTPPAGLAMALPIHYMSAGLAGACMGVGVARAFEQAKPVEEDGAREDQMSKAQ